MNNITILDIKVNSVKSSDAKATLDKIVGKGKGKLIFTPNPEMVVYAQKDDQFKNILNKSDLNIADGVGLLWAARFKTLKTTRMPVLKQINIFFQWIITLVLIPIMPKYMAKPIPERLSGSDFIWTIAEYASSNQLKIFLLGGAPTVAERCALELQTKIPDLRISGVYSGKAEDVHDIIESINKSKTDILLVAFGAPKQEKWLTENISKTNCKLGVGLGGTFDFIAGVKRRAPVFVQKIGLEWLYRLFSEPSRIYRQLAIPKFMWLVLLDKLLTTANLPIQRNYE